MLSVLYLKIMFNTRQCVNRHVSQMVTMLDGKFGINRKITQYYLLYIRLWRIVGHHGYDKIN